MRKNIVAGNWKMNKTLQEGLETISALKEALEGSKLNCEVIVATPFIHLADASRLTKDSVVKISAENCADHASGAYTGEVSAAMVASTGVSYVIIGHSERRSYYGETSEVLREKVALALENNLQPIFCIGENKEEREANVHFSVVEKQIEEALFGFSKEEFAKVVLAYEPVWAIGTGLTATSDQAEEMHQRIRSFVENKYGREVAEDLTILYGGSVSAKNAEELFARPNVDGGLVGGASLTVEQFLPIIEVFKAN